MRLKMGCLCGVVALMAAFALADSKRQLSTEYQKWLNEDVRYIITSQERQEFTELATDEARNEFVVKFWERRNPIQGSKENAFKMEHYRRLVFANQHFAAQVPGWETDRGESTFSMGRPTRSRRIRPA